MRSDVNVPFSNTVKMIEALILAGKPHDLLVLSGQGHDYWYDEEVGRFVQDATRRHFQEHLKP